MKIAVIGSRGIPVVYSGIERSLEEICPRLVSLGHEVAVYCRRYFKGLPASYQGVKLRKLPSVNTKHLDTLTHVCLSTLDVLFRKADIVHFHALGPSVFSFLPRLCGKKTVVTVHGLDWQRAKWGPIARLCLKEAEHTSAWFPNKTVVVAEPLKRYYEKNYGIEVAFIPNGVNIPEPRSPQRIGEYGLAGSDYILFLARLVPEKGCHHLIEAFSRLDTRLKLVVAGGSAHTDRYVEGLKAQATRNVIFTGRVEGLLLEELYSNAYLYVLPSEVEGFPISLLEAMSYGRCVVVSDIPENTAVIQDNGVSFPQGNVVALAQTLQGLLSQPDLVGMYGNRAKQHVMEHYSWERIVRLIEQTYASIL
jgi:glycosyltransferase involved in cell wall biosynthesis